MILQTSPKLFCGLIGIYTLSNTFHEKYFLIKQSALKNVNNSLNTNIYSYLETSGGQSSTLDLNVVHFFQHQC